MTTYCITYFTEKDSYAHTLLILAHDPFDAMYLAHGLYDIDSAMMISIDEA